MRRLAWNTLGAIAVTAFVASTGHAGGITIALFTSAAPGLRAPDGGPPAVARWERGNRKWLVFLAKNVPTTGQALAGARLKGVNGLGTTGLTIGFTVVDGLCDAGAPRFEVRLVRAGLVRLGCAHAAVVGRSRRFTAGRTYGGVLFPTGDVIQSISIVFDEGPAPVILADIFVGAQGVAGPGQSK